MNQDGVETKPNTFTFDEIFEESSSDDDIW